MVWNGISYSLIEAFKGATFECRCSQIPRNGKQPRGNLRTAFEPCSLPPNSEKHLAHQILRHCIVAGEAERISVNSSFVPSEQHMHCSAVTLRDQQQERSVSLWLGKIPRNIVWHLLNMHARLPQPAAHAG